MTAHPFKGGQHIFQAATLSFLTLDNFKSNYSAPDLDSCFERPRFENWLKYRFKIVQNFKNIKMLQIWRTVCKNFKEGDLEIDQLFSAVQQVFLQKKIPLNKSRYFCDFEKRAFFQF